MPTLPWTVTRSITIAAPAAAVHRLIDDFRLWTSWSPWEGLDPALRRTYSGPDTGVGAAYAWEGNKEAGSGSMLITASSPELIAVDLAFLKPFRSQSRTTFRLETETDGTRVTWQMAGAYTGFMALMGRFMNMDKMIGPDFDKGLAQLKAAAEA